MKKERRYKLYAMNNKDYIIDQADLNKLEANSEKMLVRLKQCIVHPSSIIVIEAFFVKGSKKILEIEGKVIDTGKFLPPPPIEDLFSPELLKLDEPK